MTIQHSHFTLQVMIGQLCRGEKGSRDSTFLSSSLILFIVQLFLFLFMWTAECNTINAFQDCLKMCNIILHLPPFFQSATQLLTYLTSSIVGQHVIRTSFFSGITWTSPVWPHFNHVGKALAFHKQKPQLRGFWQIQSSCENYGVWLGQLWAMCQNA